MLVERALSAMDALGRVIVPAVTVRPAPAVSSPDVVMVLFVRVSVPSRVAKVRVPVGRVMVPLFEMEEMTGVVKVLFVRV